MRLKILAKHLHSLRVFFRTEYGSPITSHSFREVLARVETDLIKNCEDRYGFKWTKYVTPQSFRHMHITYLQSEGMKVAIKNYGTCWACQL